jgi:DNA-binding MarR family transcriptional regulator
MNKIAYAVSTAIATASVVFITACSSGDRFSGGASSVNPVPRSASPQSQLMFDVMAAELAGRRGMLDVAANHYLNASQKTDDSRVAERATKLAIFGRHWVQAETAAARWSELDPKNPEVRQILAQIHLNQSHVVKAGQALEGLITSSSNPDEGMRRVVSVLLHDANHRAALEVTQNMLPAHAQHALLQFAHARLLLTTRKKL